MKKIINLPYARGHWEAVKDEYRSEDFRKFIDDTILV